MKDILKKYATELYYEEGEAIFFREEEVKGLHILREGKVVAEMLKENGEVKQISEIEGEDLLASAFVFGEDRHYPVDLRAKTPVKLSFIPKDLLMKSFHESPYLLEWFLEEVSSRAQFLSRQVWAQFQHKSIASKLNAYLLEREEEGIAHLDRSLKELAEHFNVTRPSLSRVLGKYVDEGILERLGRKSYRILKRETLEEE